MAWRRRLTALNCSYLIYCSCLPLSSCKVAVIVYFRMGKFTNLHHTSAPTPTPLPSANTTVIIVKRSVANSGGHWWSLESLVPGAAVNYIFGHCCLGFIIVSYYLLLDSTPTAANLSNYPYSSSKTCPPNCYSHLHRHFCFVVSFVVGCSLP